MKEIVDRSCLPGLAVLVAVEDYPGSSSRKPISHQFVHVRNLYYRDLGIDVTVLNFSEKNSYVYEGIKVIGVKDYTRDPTAYDLLLCHQPNLKHHFLFCLRCIKFFQAAVFFFHGHEVLKLSKSYPKPYPFVRQRRFRAIVRDVYDNVKFYVWRRYFAKIRSVSSFVFVSQWMYKEFMKWLKVDESFLGNRAYIIPNCIGRAFEQGNYQPCEEPEFDFVTIRGSLDTSKYAIDLVVESALRNKDLRYLIVGKGDFFNHVVKPTNVTWIDETLSHGQIVEALNNSRCALMPTRTDAQGLMMCEMASFGIPLITSDIDVCHEVLDHFENVRFVSNDNFDCELARVAFAIPRGRNKESVFSRDSTIGREVQLMYNIVSRGSE